ncbi:hypothetical protein [Pseudoroseicyclus tamaricis]|uniref:hypothetical protein n=1 Tax=Pseudoroseicyclus tamaricis TaxID=2705421 RepID=UPI002E2D25AC|nr:hypothetical protein [Pseudoroseicyclus tamaricis]
MTLFSDRLLPFTAEGAVAWGGLSAKLGHPGADLMIAVQPLVREAAVVTANVSDFTPSGAWLVDPFQ